MGSIRFAGRLVEKAQVALVGLKLVVAPCGPMIAPVHPLGTKGVPNAERAKVPVVGRADGAKGIPEPVLSGIGVLAEIPLVHQWGGNRESLFAQQMEDAGVPGEEEECLISTVVNLGQNDRPPDRSAEVVLVHLTVSNNSRLAGERVNAH
jgi:hypothetical protein